MIHFMEDVRFVDMVLLHPVFHAQTVAVNPSPKEYTTHVMYAMGVESLKTDMEIGLSFKSGRQSSNDYYPYSLIMT